MLGPVQQRILNVLSKAGREGMTIGDLVDAVYGSSGAKGPMDPQGTINVIIGTLRKLGYDIEHREYFRLNHGAARRLAAAERERDALRDRINTRLNNYLCEMKPGYNDSITGFNEAWDIVREALAAVQKQEDRG